jgi:hypothetical protein
MTDTNEATPEYSAPPLGAYPVDEHLRAQQEQSNPRTGEPLHHQDEPATEAPAPTDTAEATSDDSGDAPTG